MGTRQQEVAEVEFIDGKREENALGESSGNAGNGVIADKGCRGRRDRRG